MPASSSISIVAKRSARQPKPSPPSPIATRSNISVVIATPQPPSTGPTSLPGSRRTSSMKTSLKCASPEIWRSGRTLTPSASIGSTNIVSPRCLGTSGSVRASRSPKLACWAFVVHTFWPSMTHRPPRRSARVSIREVSEPALGSVTPKAQRSSPRATLGSTSLFIASDPCRITGAIGNM